ncbi:hypothetical protein E4U31_004494 [Claviceps sp. LM219 group G6]|nr:hypothetical protein E4U15_008277 [Claviceps sp. LM218 group G6]KAG6099212.1 hypothetical protein E4U31_004494 [Claviceps sp. LM219 group G6]
MSTPPQETGNSNDIQGATHQTNPDIFLGPRPQNFRPQRLGTSCQKVYAFTSLDSGSTPVTVSQDADRLISEIYRDRDHVVQIDSFRAMCAVLPTAPSTPSLRSSNDTTWENHTGLVS